MRIYRCQTPVSAIMLSWVAYLYLPPPFTSCWAATIYYAHTVDGPSVLVPSPPTYLVGLTTAHMYMYVLFTLIQPYFQGPRKIRIHELNRVITDCAWSILKCAIIEQRWSTVVHASISADINFAFALECANCSLQAAALNYSACTIPSVSAGFSHTGQKVPVRFGVYSV